jgi:hypothetical protein
MVWGLGFGIEVLRGSPARCNPSSPTSPRLCAARGLRMASWGHTTALELVWRDTRTPRTHARTHARTHLVVVLVVVGVRADVVAELIVEVFIVHRKSGDACHHGSP